VFYQGLRLRAAAAAAQRLGVKAEPVEARTQSELEKAFAEMMRMRVGGILVVTDPMFRAAERRLAELAAKSGLPAMYGFKSHVIEPEVKMHLGSLALVLVLLVAPLPERNMARRHVLR
jgi:hypothetical protein